MVATAELAWAGCSTTADVEGVAIAGGGSATSDAWDTGRTAGSSLAEKECVVVDGGGFAAAEA